jgi:protein-disulfide isomerase
MKKLLTAVLTIALAVGLVACKKPGATTESAAAAATPGSSDVAATIGGEKITVGELNAAAKDRLARLDTEAYRIKKGVLDGMVEDKLIAEAAKKKGVAVDKYVAEEVDSKATAPSDDELKSLFDARKGAMGNMTFDQAKGQLKDFLMQNRKAQAKQALVAKLRQDADVKINLEPPRTKIDVSDAKNAVGDKDAKVTLVEFSDYQCPFCKRVRPTVWRLVDEYKGKLRYVFMDFPLSFHKDARKASEAAWCAGDQGKYFDMNRKIFDNQDKISVDDLKKNAKDIGLDTKKFDKCLDGSAHAKDIDASTAKGAAAGVSGTPAYFINGIMISGAQPYEAFRDLVESELKR